MSPPLASRVRRTMRSFSSAAAFSVNVKATTVARFQAVVALPREQVRDPPGHHFGFAGAGAGDELQVAPAVLYRLPLRCGQFHFRHLT